MPAMTEPYPFRCPNAGRGDVDHVLRRVLDLGALRWPDRDAAAADSFVRYRELFHSYHRGVAGGLDDAGYIELVERLDRAVVEVNGRGFTATPFDRSAFLSGELGFTGAAGIWVKNETGNVAGSHKGRHLMGVLLHLEVAEATGLARRDQCPELAIASCGNAALAAGVVAKAGGRRLRVFVPVDADQTIVDRLRDLGAEVDVCPRAPGEPGDPAYNAMRRALADGALPFTCQGSQNGLVIEGGHTLGYEMACELAAAGVELDHLVVQVGGGALASACVQSLTEAVGLGALTRSPRIHTVQTYGAHPLERAYHLVAGELSGQHTNADIDRALRAAATHRSAYMWPWETEPKGIATGILDDETYDWLAVVGGMLRTGGRPVVVTEAQVAAAHALGRQAGIAVDPTGTSGLAGVLALRDEGVIGPTDRVAVLFTGVQR
jgi:threonine synthase